MLNFIYVNLKLLKTKQIQQKSKICKNEFASPLSTLRDAHIFHIYRRHIPVDTTHGALFFKP